MFENKKDFAQAFEQQINVLFGKSLDESTCADQYKALATMLRIAINKSWAKTNKTYLGSGARQIYYFSLEFLVGKFLEQNLLYLGVRDVCEDGLRELGIELKDLMSCEPDAGLGNGGLGRLAACFLDSLASMNLPGHGCGIRYKYGLFTQKIIDGYQVELPDNWLHEMNAWEVRKPDKAIFVRLGGRVELTSDKDGKAHFQHVDYLPVMAVPYDMPILGGDGETVNTLRLWSAEAVNSEFDFASFSRGDYINAVSSRYSVEAISEVLYPDDSNYNNRQLRLKQQYFFVSAGLQSIVRHYRKRGKDIGDINKDIVIHINDTHPALAVAEMMRILIDEEGLGWDDAWKITNSMMAYTNHTIMPEALEKWPVDVMAQLLPRVYMIIEEIDRRFRLDLNAIYPNDPDRVNRMSILNNGQVHMAHLAVVGSFSVNGVAAVHTELLKNEVMRDFYQFFPARFNSKTNGVTHRRWLIKANHGLTTLITDCIGDKWVKQPTLLREFNRFKDDAAACERLEDIRKENKERLAEYVAEQNGVILNINSIFDVQVKRIHAYKRQFLNTMHILHQYLSLKDNPHIDVLPRTYVLAGKAAPSYYLAKSIVKFINALGDLINNDKTIGDKLKVVFIENYGITNAELIFPASDVSEQISTASKEASGTGNMKFMLNGAVTLGTDDGANIEIRQQVGDENFFLFGLSVAEVLNYYRNGGYNAYEMYERDSRITRVIDCIRGGLFNRVPQDEFSGIIRSILDYNDEFFVLRDFDAYVAAQQRVDKAYRNRKVWNAMSIANIAAAGHFSSDNTIEQYAREIWRLTPVMPTK